MEEVGLGLTLLGIYVVVVGGGYLYDWLKKRKAKNDKVKKVLDQVHYEIEEEKRLQDLSTSSKEQKEDSLNAVQNPQECQDSTTNSVDLVDQEQTQDQKESPESKTTQVPTQQKGDSHE